MAGAVNGDNPKGLRHPSWPTLERLAPWASWIIGISGMFYPALLSGFRSLQVSFRDPSLVHYVVEHTYGWITRSTLHASFWSRG